MIKAVHFQNFKVLKRATLPLDRFTLIVGPNGSGKSTAFQGLQAVGRPREFAFENVINFQAKARRDANVVVTIEWDKPFDGLQFYSFWTDKDVSGPLAGNTGGLSGPEVRKLTESLPNIAAVYAFDPKILASACAIVPGVLFSQDGAGFAAVLDTLHSMEHERFEALNNEFSRWLPEFERILLDVLGHGQKGVVLRTSDGYRIPANQLSHGTLLALALLTLAYLPDPPSLVCLEEPDRGIHPRLLREVRDALYRLAYPESVGETRGPVQVIATTHSPYLLDLFRDHPEEIVIAERLDHEATFQRLTDRPDMEDILRDAPLGDLWYSGVLGGVPSHL